VKKDKFPLAMCSQEKSQTWEKKKLEGKASVRTRPLKIWKNKKDDMLRGSRSYICL